MDLILSKNAVNCSMFSMCQIIVCMSFLFLTNEGQAERLLDPIWRVCERSRTFLDTLKSVLGWTQDPRLHSNKPGESAIWVLSHSTRMKVFETRRSCCETCPRLSAWFTKYCATLWKCCQACPLAHIYNMIQSCIYIYVYSKTFQPWWGRIVCIYIHCCLVGLPGVGQHVAQLLHWTTKSPTIRKAKAPILSPWLTTWGMLHNIPKEQTFKPEMPLWWFVVGSGAKCQICLINCFWLDV